MGDPREPTDPFIRQALVDGARASDGATRSRRACPSCARRSPAGSSGASASRSTPTRDRSRRYGSKEAIFSLRAGRSSTRTRASDLVVVDRARLPGVRARRAASPAPRSLHAAAAARRTASSPTSTRSTPTTWRAHGARLGQLPEQPDRRRRAARVLRARSPRSRAEHDFLRRLRRGVHASSGSTSRRRRRSRSPTARNVVVFNTLSKRSSMTGYRSGFVAGAAGGDRGAAGVPADRRHRAAGVRPARVGRRLGRRGARRARRARATARKRDVLLAGARARRAARSRASEATMYLWVEVPAGETVGGVRRRGCSSTASSSRPARSSARAARATSASRSSRPMEECERAAAILEEVL